jgi:protease-4
MTEQTIRDTMGAHIFDNAIAQQFGLIDGTLDRSATIAKLAELAKVGTDYELVRPRQEQPSLLGQVLNIALPKWPGVARIATPDALHAELCAAATTTLAYYGDPRALCGR